MVGFPLSNGVISKARKVRYDTLKFIGSRSRRYNPLPACSMLLLLDNYDSFVHNLARYFERLGQQTRVVRNDVIGVADVRAMRPDAIVLSPGPCTPSEAGCSVNVVRELHQKFPILGVCLGHQ